jgi:hypothetical protein
MPSPTTSNLSLRERIKEEKQKMLNASAKNTSRSKQSTPNSFETSLNFESPKGTQELDKLIDEKVKSPEVLNDKPSDHEWIRKLQDKVTSLESLLEESAEYISEISEKVINPLYYSTKSFPHHKTSVHVHIGRKCVPLPAGGRPPVSRAVPAAASGRAGAAPEAERDRRPAGEEQEGRPQRRRRARRHILRHHRRPKVTPFPPPPPLSNFTLFFSSFQ